MRHLPGDLFARVYTPFLKYSLLAVLLAVASWGQEQPAQPQGDSSSSSAKVEQPAPEVNAKSTPAAAPTPYRLGPGDMVEVNVYNAPDLSAKLRIADDGNLYLPLIGYVHVAGLTPQESQGVIETRLDKGGFVRDPHVSLMLDQSGLQGVNILGSVARPGVYPANGGSHLLDLISAAGGFAIDAGRSVSITRHDESSTPVTVELARNVVGSGENNLPVFSGDTVFVHKAEVIYVVGDVARPAGIYIDRDNITVLQALAMAGGPTHEAKLNGARIVRKDAKGTNEIPLALKKILRAQAPDISLQPNDILFVPSRSGIFNAARGGAQLALSAATSITYLTVVH